MGCIQYKYEYTPVLTLRTDGDIIWPRKTHESQISALLWRSVCWKQAELCFHVAPRNNWLIKPVGQSVTPRAPGVLADSTDTHMHTEVYLNIY